MKNLLRLEEPAMLAISVYFLYTLNVPWWCYLLLALGPDLSMIGYALGNRAGAVSYNLFHHKATAVALYFTSLLFPGYPGTVLLIAALIIFGHSSMDRVFGYGLKYYEGFGVTHLGSINTRRPDLAD